MARPKGSRNKAKTVEVIDYAALIAEKHAAIEATNTEIASITANIDALKNDLKTRKAELKKLNKDVVKLEAQKTAADQKAAEATAEKEAIDLVKKALANGTTVDDILELLK
jgi:predicted RNase H-like nuclease (RuvC/YqgF family)